MAKNQLSNSHASDVEYVHIEQYVPASAILPEITVRGMILGIVLAILFAASSTFLGLKIARTISGSIPAAIISMMILRRFRHANILENNIVQTIASAGESVASAVIFTLPALILMGYWQHFHYFETALVAVIGGILGVMFSVPLRRSFVVKENLPYPEGLATAEILKTGEDVKHSGSLLLLGSMLGAGFSFLQSGFKVIAEQLQYWTKIGSTAFGASLALSPVMIAAGYIVGLRGLFAFAIGGIITWGIGIPLYTHFFGLPEGTIDLGTTLAALHKMHFRFMGVGILVVGGVWSVITLIPQMKQAILVSIVAMRSKNGTKGLRTQRDIPFHYVLWSIGVIALPIIYVFYSAFGKANLSMSQPQFWGIVLLATLICIVIGFVCAAIAAYIVGIVGTTSLPTSGITIVAIIIFSGILLLLFGGQFDLVANKVAALKISAFVIIFAAIVAVAGAVSGDNMQDLKAGQIVGSTPWKQQLMLIVGSVVSALVVPFILQKTFTVYGIGDVLPRPGMNPEHALPAPQATLMSTVSRGIFSGELPWIEVSIGLSLGVLAIIIDEILKRKHLGLRFPPLLLALGFYLPLSYVMGFLVGGVISLLVEKARHSKTVTDEDNGILFASGMIAGEAILGALLTIPFAYYESTDVFALNIPGLVPYQGLIAAILYLGLCIILFRQAVNPVKRV